MTLKYIALLEKVVVKVFFVFNSAIFASYLYFSTANDLEGSKQTLPLMISLGQVSGLKDIHTLLSRQCQIFPSSGLQVVLLDKTQLAGPSRLVAVLDNRTPALCKSHPFARSTARGVAAL